jgi:hypothetical protein
MKELFVIALLFAIPARAHKPATTATTWNGEVAKLFACHCTSCHNPKGPAFSLASYAEARPWAKAIRDEVLERRMPPWPAASGFNDFKNDRTLPRYVIDLLVDWAEGGAPEGQESSPRLTCAANPAAQLSSLSNVKELLASGVVDKSARSRLRSRTLRGGLGLVDGEQILAVQLRGKQGESLEARVVERDGRIRPLVWLPKFDLRAPLTYWLREPLSATPGARIELLPSSASGTIIVSRGDVPFVLPKEQTAR